MISNQDSYSQNKAKPAKDCIMVIFGAGGDLTSRLLLPTILSFRCRRFTKQ
jgi:glucose-6-phosphate 1-dehydrogenase